MRVCPARFEFVLGGRQQQRRGTPAMPVRQHKDLRDASALPTGEADDLFIDSRDDTIGQRRFDPRQEELKGASHGNLRREMGVTLMPSIMPNASERRNVSGARLPDRQIGVGAQRPSTAFAMMLRWTSFEPA